MTEREYVDATNLAKLRLAISRGQLSKEPIHEWQPGWKLTPWNWKIVGWPGMSVLLLLITESI